MNSVVVRAEASPAADRGGVVLRFAVLGAARVEFWEVRLARGAVEFSRAVFERICVRSP